MRTLTEFSPILLRSGDEVRSAKAAEGLEGDALTEAVAAALSLPPSRAARLLEALDVVGDLGVIRQVRVFQGEAGPAGSISKGEFHYVVDRVVTGGARRDRGGDRGGRGGGRGDRGGRGGGGGRPGMPGGKNDKPRGLGTLRGAGAQSPPSGGADRFEARGDTPRAGQGWELTPAPRESRGGPGGDRGRGPGASRGPRPNRGSDARRPPGPGGRGANPRGPRLGPDGKPLPPRWPDANGNGPDGKPWRGGRRATGAQRPADPAAPAAATETAPPTSDASVTQATTDSSDTTTRK